MRTYVPPQSPGEIALRKATDRQREALACIADGRWHEADDATLHALAGKGYIKLRPIEPTKRGEFAISALKEAA